MEVLLSYFILGLTFNTSVTLSSAKSIGVNAQEFEYPANVEEDKVLLQIIFVKFDAQSQKELKMSDAELLNYAKTTFLGTGKPAENFKERQIIGSKSKGEVLKTKIPTLSNIEIHLITLNNSTKFAIAFKSLSSLNSDELESIILEVTGSLTVK